MSRTFTIVKTEAEAERFCLASNAFNGFFDRFFHRAYYQPWSSPDGSDTGFICWYWE